MGTENYIVALPMDIEIGQKFQLAGIMVLLIVLTLFMLAVTCFVLGKIISNGRRRRADCTMANNSRPYLGSTHVQMGGNMKGLKNEIMFGDLEVNYLKSSCVKIADENIFMSSFHSSSGIVRGGKDGIEKKLTNKLYM